MKKLWKRRAAVLGVAVLVASQSYFVLAEEHPEQEEILLQEEETVVVETEKVAYDVLGEEEVNATKGDVDKLSDTRSLQPATDLKWSDRGEGNFYNPNEAAVFMAYVYHEPDHTFVDTFYDGRTYSQGEVNYDLYHVIEACGKDGEYTFEVEAIYWNGEVREMSALSESFSYTKPTDQLPAPKLTVSESGLVSCIIAGVDEYVLGDDYGVEYEAYEGGTRIFQWGSNSTEVDLGELGYVKEGHMYLIKARTLSRRIDKLVSSEWSEYTLDLRTEKNSPTSSSSSFAENSGSSVAATALQTWQPTTPDEIKRYAAFGTEKVDYATDEANEYRVTIYNAMQGGLCYDSFEAVLGDYVIGRTYNIFPSDKIVYQMDSKARITLNIPKALQADNRTFQMICVTANGQPIILKDLDSNPETITFETDTYYAFALIYKDIK